MRAFLLLLLLVVAVAALFLTAPPRTAVQVADGVEGLVERAAGSDSRQALETLRKVRRDLAERFGATVEEGLEALRERLAAVGRDEISASDAVELFRRLEREISRLEAALGDRVATAEGGETAPSERLGEAWEAGKRGAVLLVDEALGRGWIVDNGRVSRGFAARLVATGETPRGWFRPADPQGEGAGGKDRVFVRRPFQDGDPAPGARLRLVSDLGSGCGEPPCVVLPLEMLPRVATALSGDGVVLVAAATD